MKDYSERVGLIVGTSLDAQAILTIKRPAEGGPWQVEARNSEGKMVGVAMSAEMLDKLIHPPGHTTGEDSKFYALAVFVAEYADRKALQ